MSVPSVAFEFTANSMIGKVPGLAQDRNGRKLRSLFGVSSETCATLWGMIETKLPHSAQPVHLLWGLLFLKVYATEHVNSVIAGVDGKTFRCWSWRMVDLLSKIKIDWNSREIAKSYGNCRVSVGGTDFRIFEPSPFDSKWFSHKFKGPGLRYEIGLCIETALIVWSHGPFPCGAFPDVNIFRLALKNALADGEKVVADGGYNDGKCRTRGKNPGFEEFDAVFRARHETVNRRFKQFFVLSHRFRHRLDLHSRCFHAVCVQVSLTLNEPLFNIE